VAATLKRPEVLRILVDLRWDINALGRTDRPNSKHAWHTALHHAADAGDVDLARTLLELGADPAVRDRRFDGTPLDWARHANRPELVLLLEPLTPTPLS
jgi:ankyrin repeat protein